MSLAAGLAADAVPLPPRVRSERPVIGCAAVMAGAVISTLNSRVTTFGLADIRGGLGLGFDEGSWITTVFFAAQMAVAPAAAWMSTVLGTRRVLVWTSLIFAALSILPPFLRDYDTLIAVQLVRGLAVGAFIPAALGFILRSLAPQWWIWGIAAYAFRFVFSQNIGGAIEGWYSDNGHWQWIFWENAVLAPVMTVLVMIAIPQRPVDRELWRRTDVTGIVYAGLGFALIYAGLDQGDRLDWFNSGTVNGLLLAGALLVAAFIIHEMRAPYPLIHPRVAVRPSVGVPAILIGIYGFGGVATSYVLPNYLTTVQGLRALQISDALYWIALPQFVVVPVVALILQRVDARIPLMLGFAVISVGSWIDTSLTHDWAPGNFVPSAAIEGLGLALAITALVTYTISNITPPQAAAIAATIQIARLMGAELGNALIQTFVRVREQTYSNLVGLHLTVGSPAAEQAASLLSGPYGSRPTGAGDASLQGVGLLAGLVRREAHVLADIDAFWLVAWVTGAATLLALLLPRPPPNPLTPPRIVPGSAPP